MEYGHIHPATVMALCSAILLLTAFVLLMRTRYRIARKDKERAKEIERMFAYVCEANESVLEINLDTMSCEEYFLEDHVLCTKKRTYITEGNEADFMHPEDYANTAKTLTQERLDEIIRTGGEVVFEARGKTKTGTYAWYIYTIHGLIPDAAHPHNFMLFKRNISALKQKEEEGRQILVDALNVAREASEAKGVFMSRMSHEIRTPLNAVMGYMELAKGCSDVTERAVDYIEKSQTAARHLLNIINNVLDISSIESGGIKIAYEEIDLKELLSCVSQMFYGQAKEKGIRFRVEINDMTHERVMGDALRLNQILINLLSNAMKFTPESGTVTVSVTQLQESKEQVHFRFAVSDTGVGMSEEFMSRIFTPFEQETATTARQYGGSGLGLSITRNLVTMMQGSIDVESREGSGTTFTVHMAFGKSGEQSHEVGASGNFSRVRALIVGEESSCVFMKSLLTRCEVKSDAVYSGADAVRQIMRRQGGSYAYDMCLIDWDAPDTCGAQTAGEIRAKCLGERPAIIAVAYDVNEIGEDARAAGVHRIIAKPLFQSTMYDLLVDTYGGELQDEAAVIADKGQELTGIRLLLAEDNTMNLEIAVNILQKGGLLVDTATDGRMAYEKFVQSEQGTYQAILMDVQMPVMDGYAATRAIRGSDHPQAGEIPILAMTANAFVEDVTAALSAGMNDHIAKPVNYDKLYMLLHKYIKLPQ